jgi:hypothetical protein
LLVAGKYKNAENEKYIQFGLDIDGKKHFDAELGLKVKDVKYGHIYQPKLYLAINNERIAELSGEIFLLHDQFNWHVTLIVNIFVTLVILFEINTYKMTAHINNFNL